MCGIAGYLLRDPRQTDEELTRAVAGMTQSLTHRGPDGEGVWVDAEAGIALGHRRLSVIDLSSAGAQPMVSPSGRFVISMNGEIYNFRALRRELEAAGYHFRGHSDTEVASAAIEEWSVHGACEKFVGMFAFAIWDQQARALYLVRDRIGEKPLYYGWAGGCVMFGSELKALRRHPAWRGGIDRDALATLLRYTYIPAPHCIYQNVRKVLPGCIVKLAPAMPDGDYEHEAYWSADTIALDGLSARDNADEKGLEDELDALLRETIQDKMIADVPLGAFLSGGIDSSTVVAVMQNASDRPIRTFSIGFHEEEYNEATYAKRVAAHLGTDHTELYVTPSQARNVIPLLPELYDEPFSDSSQIPTYLIAQLARQDVTVALTGDGGDELFGGYNRYLISRNVWGRMSRIPLSLRRAGGTAISTVPIAAWNRIMRAVRPLLPRRLRYRQFGEKLHKLMEVWQTPTPDLLYLRLISLFDNPSQVVLDSREPPFAARFSDCLAQMDDFTDRMMFVDLVTYLPDDILVKVDRASMGVSLETRVPFLDHRLVEFCWRLKLQNKIRNGSGKWLLRKVLARYVPADLFERPKMGFGVPIDHWLRDPLRDWGESLLDEKLLREQGYFNAELVRQTWNAHQSGESAEHYRLWPLLMFQSWLQTA